MNPDDRLSLDPPGGVEGGDGIVEGSHFADVCPQPAIANPLDGLTQLGAIGYDDEVDSQASLKYIPKAPGSPIPLRRPHCDCNAIIWVWRASQSGAWMMP
jgi:hypothetical protein